MLRPAGRVVVIGYADQEFTAVYQHIMLKEKEIVGCRASNLHELKEVIRLVERGVIDPYIYRTYPFEAIKLWMTCGMVKAWDGLFWCFKVKNIED